MYCVMIDFLNKKDFKLIFLFFGVKELRNFEKKNLKFISNLCGLWMKWKNVCFVF